jgi:hypothetical protein
MTPVKQKLSNNERSQLISNLNTLKGTSKQETNHSSLNKRKVDNNKKNEKSNKNHNEKEHFFRIMPKEHDILKSDYIEILPMYSKEMAVDAYANFHNMDPRFVDEDNVKIRNINGNYFVVIQEGAVCATENPNEMRRHPFFDVSKETKVVEFEGNKIGRLEDGVVVEPTKVIKEWSPKQFLGYKLERLNVIKKIKERKKKKDPSITHKNNKSELRYHKNPMNPKPKKTKNVATKNKSKAQRRIGGWVHGYYRSSTKNAFRANKPKKHIRWTKAEINTNGGTQKEKRQMERAQKAKEQFEARQRRNANIQSKKGIP